MPRSRRRKAVRPAGRCYERAWFPVAVASLCYAQVVGAADWRITPFVSIGEIYTDNVNLAPAGGEREEYITELSPGFALEGRGARADVSLNYNVQQLWFSKDSSQDSTNHRLDAGARTEIVKDHFFLEGLANIGQRVVDPSDSIPLDNINARNRTDVTSLGLSPIFRTSLGGYADLGLRYEYTTSQFDRGAADSVGSTVVFDAASGRKAGRLRWLLNYTLEKQDRDDNLTDVEFEHAEAELRYAISRDFSGVLRGGYEYNRFDTARALQNGSFGEAGISWHPTRRFTLNLLYGDRSQTAEVSWQPNRLSRIFVQWRDREVGLNTGQVWSANISLRSRRREWLLSYGETTTTSQQAAFVGELFANFDEDLPRFNLDIDDVLALTNEVFVRKRGQLSYNYTTPKTRFRFLTFSEEREFEVLRDDEQVIGFQGSFDWRFVPRMRLRLGGVRHRVDFRSSTREDDLMSGSFGLTRQLTRRLDAELDYRYTAVESNASAQDYEENRVSLRMIMRF